MLLNLAYFDLLYHIIALTVCLETLAVSEKLEAPTLTLVPPSETPWWEQSRAT